MHALVSMFNLLVLCCFSVLLLLVLPNSYFKKYNYQIKETGDVITFEGIYAADRGQAAAVTFYTFAGALLYQVLVVLCRCSCSIFVGMLSHRSASGD
jgi:hypothetical protein